MRLEQRAATARRLMGTGRRWTNVQMLDALRASAEGGRTSSKRYDRWRQGLKGDAPSRTMIGVRFGSWLNALDAAGLERNERGGRLPGRGRWPREAMLAKLREAADEVGHPPTIEEYKAFRAASSEEAPCDALVRNALGGWIAALEAAELGR